MGNAAAISLGPGTLKIAPLGSTEPTDLSTAWDAAWVDLGYTAEGSEFSYEVSTEPVDVAEEFEPIRIMTTGRSAAVSFALAELTAANLKRALNGGTITSGTGLVTFEPPAVGEEVRVMLGFESEDGEERWVYRQCFQMGSLTIARRKAPDKATLPVEFGLEKPSGAASFKAIFDDARTGT